MTYGSPPRIQASANKTRQVARNLDSVSAENVHLISYLTPVAVNVDSSTSVKQTSNPDQSVFQISYGDGSQFSGQYYVDKFKMGGATVDNAEFALVTDVQNDITDANGLPSTTGVFGISFPNGEATVSQDQEPQYKGILQAMKTAGVIDTIAYSLWLNDPSQ